MQYLFYEVEREKYLFFRLESSPAVRSISQTNKQRICHSPVNNNIFLEQNNKQKILSDSTSSTGIRLTCLLLIISFIFVICTLPISIRLLIADYLPSQKSSTRVQIAQLSLTLLMYFNHTVMKEKNDLNEFLLISFFILD
jgi:hypothetical protein